MIVQWARISSCLDSLEITVPYGTTKHAWHVHPLPMPGRLISQVKIQYKYVLYRYLTSRVNLTLSYQVEKPIRIGMGWGKGQGPKELLLF